MMAANPNTPGEFVSGVVASVNPKGLRLEGESEWRNFSKFARDLVPPMRSQLVTATLDRAGFIRAIATVDGQAITVHQSPVAGRETAITRLAVLKAATSFCAARPDLKSADLFALAERMEAWVTR
jgi:hypothetical protein